MPDFDWSNVFVSLQLSKFICCKEALNTDNSVRIFEKPGVSLINFAIQAFPKIHAQMIAKEVRNVERYFISTETNL